MTKARPLRVDELVGIVADTVAAGARPAGQAPAADGPPLWVANRAQDGRGFLQPDGRLLSPQELAYGSPADELFFGGAGGGGKTDLLLGLALTEHENSIIFRQEFTQFGGANGMLARAEELIGLRGDYNGNEHIWRNLPGRRALEFGAARTLQNAFKYRGRPHDLKAFDELPEMEEAVYRFLIGWLRTTNPRQRARVVATGNPPMTTDGQWVLRYWAPWLDLAHPRPAVDGELRWFAQVDGKEVEVPGPADGWERAPAVATATGPVHPRSRTFIRALVEDNPYYMRTGYDRVLDALPEPMRSQMRFGNFHAAVQDDPWQVVPTAWVQAAMARWTPDPPGALTAVGCDPSWGGSDQFVIAKRHGAWTAPLEKHEGVEAHNGIRGAQLLFASLGGDREVPIQIDVGSAGAACYEQAGQLGLRALAMNGAAKAVGLDGKPTTDRSGKLTFANKRAEWHWRMREALDPAGGQDLALPPDPQLRADLCAPRWRPTPRGIQVEPKEDIKARLGRSPDCGEACIYAHAQDYLARKAPSLPVVVW